MDKQSSSQQQHKQQRRKRKDPQSRDFVCRCGKSYLSYAAAYTHVKNKHGGDNQYLNNISKPDRQKLKRGRPKEKKVFCITLDTQKLSIIQQAILLIYEALEKAKGNSSKIILQGNLQISLKQLMIVYQQQKKALGQPGLTLFVNREGFGETGKMLSEFIQNLIKHFVPGIAVKVIWLINYLFAEQVAIVNGHQAIQINLQNVRNKINDEVCQKLWDGVKDIPLIIFDTLEKWVKVVQRANQNILQGE